MRTIALVSAAVPGGIPATFHLPGPAPEADEGGV
jgi:hypothetical protein